MEEEYKVILEKVEKKCNEEWTRANEAEKKVLGDFDVIYPTDDKEEMKRLDEIRLYMENVWLETTQGKK